MTLPEHSPSRQWPLVGMLALGLVAGSALGGYLVSQRSRMKQVDKYAHRMRDELDGMGKHEVKPVAVATSTRSNHRRKAASEV